MHGLLSHPESSVILRPGSTAGLPDCSLHKQAPGRASAAYMSVDLQHLQGGDCCWPPVRSCLPVKKAGLVPRMLAIGLIATAALQVLMFS